MSYAYHTAHQKPARQPAPQNEYYQQPSLGAVSTGMPPVNQNYAYTRPSNTNQAYQRTGHQPHMQQHPQQMQHQPHAMQQQPQQMQQQPQQMQHQTHAMQQHPQQMQQLRMQNPQQKQQPQHRQQPQQMPHSQHRHQQQMQPQQPPVQQSRRHYQQPYKANQGQNNQLAQPQPHYAPAASSAPHTSQYAPLPHSSTEMAFHPQAQDYSVPNPYSKANEAVSEDSFHFEAIRSPQSQTFSFEDKPALPPKIPMISASPSLETLSKHVAVSERRVNNNNVNNNNNDSLNQEFYAHNNNHSDNSVDDLIDRYIEGVSLVDAKDSKQLARAASTLRNDKKLRPASIVKELEIDSPPPYEELDHSKVGKFPSDAKKPRKDETIAEEVEPLAGVSSSKTADSVTSAPYPTDDPLGGVEVKEKNGRPRRYTDELLLEVKEQSEQRRISSEYHPSVSGSKESLPLENVDPVTNFMIRRREAVNDYRTFTFQIQLDWAKVLVQAIDNNAIITAYNITGQQIRTLTNPSDVRKNVITFLNAAIKVLKKLSEKFDDTESQALLGDIYSGAKASELLNKEKSFEYYLKATKGKNASATYKVGCCLEHGMGTRKDLEKCFYFYEKSALLGDSDGMCKLGIIYIKGLLGQPKSAQKAVYWLNKAIVSDDASVLPVFILAKIHETDVITLNLRPHKFDADAKVITELQRMGIYKDHKTALKLYLKAAKLGHIKSQTHLGYCYEFGSMGCNVDPRTSIYWYSKSAQKGDPNAEMGLSGWYLTGAEGLLAQNDVEAYLWARKASEKGLAKAEYALGYFNEVGVGTQKNLSEAMRWYKVAASQGYSKALKKLELFK